MENNVKCELCGLEMKTRINSSHLLRIHNITLNEYKKQFPVAVIGKRTPKIQKYVCQICNKKIGSVQHLSQHLQNHSLSSENYFIKYILNGNAPLCKCGCQQHPSFISAQKGYHEYVTHHNPVWNRGLNKIGDERVNHMYDNRKVWNKGLSKFTSANVKDVANKIRQSWNEENLKQRSASYRKNMMRKYGVVNGFQLDSVKEKSKQTLLKRFGVEHPQFSNECKFKWKTYTFPDGKRVKCQGYENFGLDLLLSKYDSEDIVVDRKLIPKINYTDFDGKYRRYCPDMWIPKDNLIVETKSNYTYGLHKQNVHHKKIGVLSLGYQFQLLVFNDDGTLNTTINE